MNVFCEVLEQVAEKFQTKRGMKEIMVLVCLDRGPGASLRNTFDYEMTEEECVKFSGKLPGKTVEVGIRDMKSTFAGRIRFIGQIVRVGNEEVAS